MDRNEQRDQLFKNKFISLNTIVVSRAKPILAQSLVGTFTKFVRSNRSPRFVVAGFYEYHCRSNFSVVATLVLPVHQWRKEAIDLRTKPRITKTRRQSQSR